MGSGQFAKLPEVQRIMKALDEELRSLLTEQLNHPLDTKRVIGMVTSMLVKYVPDDSKHIKFHCKMDVERNVCNLIPENLFTGILLQGERVSYWEVKDETTWISRSKQLKYTFTPGRQCEDGEWVVEPIFSGYLPISRIEVKITIDKEGGVTYD